MERLHFAARSLPDVQVISFNVDEPDAKIPDRNYRLPVILMGADYVKRMVDFDKLTLPKFWVVNRDGVIVRETSSRITGDSDKWIEEQLRLLRQK